MTYYHIKYGNRLYLAYEDIHKVLWTHNVNEAITLYTNDEANETLDQLRHETGLYEARVVDNSDIAIVVDDVP